MYESLEFFLYLGLAIPAILIDRSATCTGSAKMLWWCLSAASGIAGLLLPPAFALMVPNAAVPMRADKLLGFALPWIVYALYRVKFAGSGAAADGAERKPADKPSPTTESSAIGTRKTTAKLADIIGSLRTVVIVFCILVAGYVLIVVGIMACCSR